MLIARFKVQKRFLISSRLLTFLFSVLGLGCGIKINVCIVQPRRNES